MTVIIRSTPRAVSYSLKLSSSLVSSNQPSSLFITIKVSAARLAHRGSIFLIARMWLTCVRICTSVCVCVCVCVCAGISDLLSNKHLDFIQRCLWFPWSPKLIRLYDTSCLNYIVTAFLTHTEYEIFNPMFNECSPLWAEITSKLKWTLGTEWMRSIRRSLKRTRAKVSVNEENKTFNNLSSHFLIFFLFNDDMKVCDMTFNCIYLFLTASATFCHLYRSYSYG